MPLNLALSLHYGLTIFLSAFLLFQVQPMLGKMILPWFGGSASVWTICMLFFQTVLLLGYCYSHWVVRYLAPAKQSLLHAALLIASLSFLPITPSEAWRPTGSESPTLQILGLLTVTIGLPYFVLSTTGPLLQVWFSRERPGMLPYRLFALSNFGSMIALLAYPLAIEPALPSRLQSLTWSGLFIAFALACGALAWRGRQRAAEGLTPSTHAHAETGPAPKPTSLLLWALLATCPSLLMVATTSYMTENIAPIPLLWVGPLGLYLLSFIFCFERHGWYQRRLFLPLMVLALATLAYLPTLGVSGLPLELAVGLNLAAFFVVCMVCHGELARRQPAPAHLTVYYLMLALGGAFGGFFVGIVAPLAFNGNYELSVGLIVTAVVASIAVFATEAARSSRWRRPAIAAVALFIAGLGALRVADHREDNEGADLIARNFYGTIRVFTNTEIGYRSMMHGQIVHGRQFTDPARELEPTAYYGTNGGAGRVLQIKAAATTAPLHIGLVGMGIGTLAAYGRAGDRVRLYEIDPLVTDIAHTHFRFLSASKGANTVVLGDARLQLANEAPQQFDVLVIDAFSGDAVPVHLLTDEAFSLYQRHLKPDGVIAVHITNRFLDLRPVIASGAAHLGFTARVVDADSDSKNLQYRSRWVILSPDSRLFEHARLADAALLKITPGFKPWRDDYSSLLSVLAERRVD